MAIYHCTAKVVSRGKGQSVVAKAAYNARACLEDERDGKTHDYARREGLMFEGIFAPPNAPEWAKDRQELWAAVERGEKRRDAQLAREVEVALPHELTDRQRERLVKDFVREAFVRKGMVADVCLHAPSGKGDTRNHHAHILLTMRELGPDGFGPKVREWNSSEQLEQWRSQWENLTNRHLERHGHEARIDRRTLEAQGIEREPTIHLGPRIAATEAKGRPSARGERQQEIRERNRERERLQQALAETDRELARETARAQAPEKAAATAERFRSAGRETARPQAPAGRTAAGAARDMGQAADRGLRVTSNVVGRAADKLVDVVDGLLDVFAGPTPRKNSVAEFLNSPEARREHYRQTMAARQRDEALDRMAEDMRSGRNLSGADVRYLTHADMLGIKDFGDDYMKKLVEEREQERKRDWGGRERER